MSPLVSEPENTRGPVPGGVVGTGPRRSVRGGYALGGVEGRAAYRAASSAPVEPRSSAALSPLTCAAP